MKEANGSFISWLTYSNGSPIGGTKHVPESFGQPANPSADIPLCVPHLTGKEKVYLNHCLESGWLSTAGPFVQRFEQQFQQAIKAPHAVATASGTSALHIALLVAGVQPDDEVLVSAMTFIAPANAIRYAGAWPVFIDAEPTYWQMDPDAVTRFIHTSCSVQDGHLLNKRTQRRIAAILPVHILGHPVDMAPILELARHYEIPVIEDASESLGATYHAQSIGRLGDIACFSFNGNKLITSGAGGMIVTSNRQWAERARHLTTQAISNRAELIHDAIGFNYRLSNLQAAVGLAQLEDLTSRVDSKRRIAHAYASAFEREPGIDILGEAPWATSSHWLSALRLAPMTEGVNRYTLIDDLRRQGIETRPLWQPLHLSPAYRDRFPTHCPVAEMLYESVVCLPSSVALPPEDQQRVISSIRASLETHTRPHVPQGKDPR